MTQKSIPTKPKYESRVVARVTENMHQRLREVGHRKGLMQDTQILRDAIRFYLDHQTDLLGSKGYFTQTVRNRLDAHEEALSFQLSIIINILAKGIAAIITLLGQLLEMQGGQRLSPTDPNTLIRDGVQDAIKNHERLLKFIARIQKQEGDQS